MPGNSTQPPAISLVAVTSGHHVTIFFYNPNIHPREEYEIRKEENKRFAERMGTPFVDADYDTDEWFKRAKGMEFDPERGRRCTMCFDMRMERTAYVPSVIPSTPSTPSHASCSSHQDASRCSLYAFENGFDCFTTTNATSRWKDQDQVNGSGFKAAAKYNFMPYFWKYDWQTDQMTERKRVFLLTPPHHRPTLTPLEESCNHHALIFAAGIASMQTTDSISSYSLRDSNIWRKQNNIPPVRIGGETAGLGTRYYENPEADSKEESIE
ncbi:MAG: hypothetical protein SGPRY_015032, partial [Prymnesium sp.]